MLVFDLSGFSDPKIDYELISAKSSSIGKETRQMWEQLVKRAKDEIAKHKI
jgi:hypothetical protein